MRVIVTARCQPETPLRWRNLGVCLRQLADARRCLPETCVRVVVAEHDAAPRLATLAATGGAEHVFLPGDGLFCKGAALNAGAAGGHEPLLCLLDADCWVGRDWLAKCLALIDGWRHDGTWRGAMLPYERFRFLEAQPSDKVAAGTDPSMTMEHEACPSCGGAAWCDRALWERIGGADEGYVGWGPDDRDLECRLEAAMGAPLLRGDLPLWHLFHERPDTSTNDAGWARLLATRARLGR